MIHRKNLHRLTNPLYCMAIDFTEVFHFVKCEYQNLNVVRSTPFTQNSMLFILELATILFTHTEHIRM